MNYEFLNFLISFQLLLLVVGVSCAPQRGQQQQRPGPYGPQAAPARYPNQAPVYRDEMNKNYPREETPVYREQEKPLEKRQAAYAPAPVEKLPPQPFQYEYGVKDDYSGNAFAKTETQNDLGQVQGSYKVNLPDGRIQTVTYRADHEGGFVAEVFSLPENSPKTYFFQVTYEGTPQYPEPPPGGYGPYKVNETSINPEFEVGQWRNFWYDKQACILNFSGSWCLPWPPSSRFLHQKAVVSSFQTVLSFVNIFDIYSNKPLMIEVRLFLAYLYL